MRRGRKREGETSIKTFTHTDWSARSHQNLKNNPVLSVLFLMRKWKSKKYPAQGHTAGKRQSCELKLHLAGAIH